MAAPKRVPDAEVVRLIQEWRGCVEIAAERAGMAANNFRKRLSALNVDLSLLRAHQGYGISRTHPNVSRPNVSTLAVPTAQRKGRAIFTRSKGVPILATMRTEAVAAEDLPIKTTRLAARPVRVKPDQQERLQRAAWALQARYEAPTDSSLILEQFIEEGFEAWLRKKLDTAK